MKARHTCAPNSGALPVAAPNGLAAGCTGCPKEAPKGLGGCAPNAGAGCWAGCPNPEEPAVVVVQLVSMPNSYEYYKTLET